MIKSKSSSGASKMCRNHGSFEPSQTLTEQQMRELLEAAGTVSPDLEEVVELGYLTGLRMSEIINLKYEDIDFAGRVLIIPSDKCQSHPSRVIPVGERAMQLLRSLSTDQRKPVPLTGQFLTRQFEKASRLAGVNATFHSLRRSTYQWLMEDGGLSASQIDRIVGHRLAASSDGSTAISDDNYGNDKIRAAQEKVAARIKYR